MTFFAAQYGLTLLLYNIANRSVVLTRQFGFPTYVNGNPDGRLLDNGRARRLIQRTDPASAEPVDNRPAAIK
ncbi:MAG: hypothetical protein AB8B63_15545, partial [Granulosicoccus sp.]